MTPRQLDQFYTKKEISNYYFQLVKNHVDDFQEYFLLEPSAGDGAFSDLFGNQVSVSIDIDPKRNYMIPTDFLEMEFDFLAGRKVITIGNPPFGKNSSLAIKFFNKSSKLSKYVCFILPQTFRKSSIMNVLDRKMFLIFDDDIPRNSFLFNNEEYDVPCVFQIWRKDIHDRPLIELKKTTKYFSFVDKSNGDIAIRRVGGLAGKVILDFNKYKEASHYFLKIADGFNKDKIVNLLTACFEKFQKSSFNVAGNPSISKGELISIFEEEIKNDRIAISWI